MKLPVGMRATSMGAVALALVLGVAFGAGPVLAEDTPTEESSAKAVDGRVVQNDPDNPVKFSIDGAIAGGDVSTPDLYIGTVGSYLGSKADGKTPVFADGAGQNPNDVLIMNDKVGIVLAAGTPDPWGYPGGSILDAGRVTVPAGATDLKGASFGTSTVLTAQFLFNEWDAWAPSNAGMVNFDLVNYNFETKKIDDVDGMPAVKVNRKFTVPFNSGGVSTARDLDVVSYYSIGADNDYAYWFDSVHNNGSAFSTDAVNEVVISNKGSVGVDTKTVNALTAANTYNWVEGDPAKQFSTTMISPGTNVGSDGREHPFSQFAGARGYRELQFKNPEWIEDETRLYETYLMIDDQASWQKVFDFWADYKGLETFNVTGTVKGVDGKPVSDPVVIVYRGAELYGWVMGDKNGNYSVDLPNENSTQAYDLRVEKDGTVPSAASSTFTSATVPAGGIDLQAGAYKVPVTFTFKDQNDDPIWGRVTVGANPLVTFTGQNFFLPDNDGDSVKKGVVTAQVAPGNYSATALGEGYGFYSYTTNRSTFSQTVTGNTATDVAPTVVINKTLSAPTDWFSVDNHHHGGRSDAFSPPEVSAKAQAVAGLEVPSLSDHQYVLDNCPVYTWSRKLGAIGYMPSEEVTPSWAHHNIMPLTKYAYNRFRDCDQVNPIINTNTAHQGIIDDGHNAGVAIGINHPNSGYGLFLADDNKTVPGGMSEDFDGIEAQFSKSTLNEAFSFWSAYQTGGTYRGVKVTKPHYIHASTDIHDSGGTTGSGGRRSYVYVENGKSKSKADFDDFSLDFSRSQAAGHSFNSSGVFIEPTSGKVYGNTYPAKQDGTFSADFKVSSLNNITDVYVFSSTGKDTATGSFQLNNMLSRTTYSGADLAKSKAFTLSASGITGKQWYSIAAVSSNGKLAITNPIWVEGPDVAGTTEKITSVDTVLNEPVLPSGGGAVKQPPTAIMTSAPWSGFLFADWKQGGGNGSAEDDAAGNLWTLTFTAPDGFAFDTSLTDPAAGIRVWQDGAASKLTYRRDLAPPGAAPTATSRPKLTGKPQVGKTLAVSTGKWSASGLTLTYQWKRNGVPIAGATGRFYRARSADAGEELAVTVTAKRTGYRDGSATTAPPLRIKRASRATLKVPRSAAAGRKTRITAVIKAGGTARPTGTVTFYDGTKKLKSVSLKAGSKGVAAYSVKLKAGTHRLKVVYSGSGSVLRSASRVVTVKVRK